MELALNLAWLGIAIVIVSLFVFYRCLGERKANSIAPWRMWVALGCGLILLFFVISCTDDLNEQILTIEDSSFSWRHTNTCRRYFSPDSPGGPGHALAPVPATAFPFSDRRLWTIAPAEPHQFLNSPPLKRPINRGPPQFPPHSESCASS
jgi:hypothetical protein